MKKIYRMWCPTCWAQFSYAPGDFRHKCSVKLP